MARLKKTVEQRALEGLPGGSRVAPVVEKGEIPECPKWLNRRQHGGGTGEISQYCIGGVAKGLTSFPTMARVVPRRKRGDGAGEI